MKKARLVIGGIILSLATLLGVVAVAASDTPAAANSQVAKCASSGTLGDSTYVVNDGGPMGTMKVRSPERTLAQGYYAYMCLSAIYIKHGYDVRIECYPSGLAYYAEGGSVLDGWKSVKEGPIYPCAAQGGSSRIRLESVRR